MLKVAISILAVILASGCLQGDVVYKYVCPDASVVNDPEECELTTQTTTETTEETTVETTIETTVNETTTINETANETTTIVNETTTINETTTTVNETTTTINETTSTTTTTTIPAVNHLIFTEVFYDAPGIDSEEEFLEIYNPTQDKIELINWSITDNAGTWSFPEITINSGSYLTIARDSDGFQNLFGCLPHIDTFTRALNNDGDHLTLRNGEQEIDYVAWEGDWNIEAATGKSIKRISIKDTDKVEDWEVGEPDPAC